MKPVESTFPPVIVDSNLLRQLTDESVRDVPLDEIHDWNQRQRDRWVEARARSVTSGSKVLDVGAGTCPYKKHFSHCTYHAHDFKRYEGSDYLKREPELAADGYGKIDFVSDITDLPVKSASYDVVICTEVFEHIPEPILALQELSRVLKPGGRLFLTAPLASGLHQLPFHFYGGYTPEWYRRFCPEMGLSISSIDALGGYFKMLSQECARFAWTMDEHRDLHGERADTLSKLFADTLSRYFYALDAKRSLENFTAGYLVEANRMSSLDQIQRLIDHDPSNSRLFVSATRLALDSGDLQMASTYYEDLEELDGGSRIAQALKIELKRRKLVGQ